MANFLKGKKLFKVDGEGEKAVVPEEHLKGKVVALYFSAHWCPPCRMFTPVLKDFYEEVEKDGLEVIFLSLDRSAEDLKSYMKEAHGEWCFLKHGDADIEALSKHFGVNGIPALIIIKPDGSVAIENGRGDVQSKGPSAFKAWKSSCGL